MIPSEQQAKQLWETYHVPEYKRKHMALVANVAKFFATQCTMQNVHCDINEELLTAAALLHDIDKNIPRRPGERHPDTAVRVLHDEGMDEVSELIATHPVHAIRDPRIAPKTWEEKLLYLADKMVKHEIISVDERFALWRKENLSDVDRDMLEKSYPKVKALEAEIFRLAGISPGDIPNIARVAK